MIFIPKIEFQWFYSALSQSLAALIGIVGMFIVYRLQIQQNNINNAVRNLQNSMVVGKPELYSHLSRDETIKEGQYRIKQLQGDIEFQEKMIKQLDEQLSKGKISELDYNREKDNCLNIVKNRKQEIFRFQIRINKIVEREHWRNNIKYSAFVIILYLIGLFCLSLIGLLYSNHFSKNIFLGNMFTIAIFCLLLGGLLNLVICCAVSLDIGRPRI